MRRRGIARVLLVALDPRPIDPPVPLARPDGLLFHVATEPPPENCPLCESPVDRADDPYTTLLTSNQRWIAKRRYRCGAIYALSKMSAGNRLRWRADAPCRRPSARAILAAVGEWANDQPLGDVARVIADLLASHGIGGPDPLPARPIPLPDPDDGWDDTSGDDAADSAEGAVE